MYFFRKCLCINCIEMKKKYSDPYQLGQEILNYVKKETPVFVKDLQEVLDIHPSNISKRLGENNFKVLELVDLANFLKAPLIIQFGSIVCINAHQEEADTIQSLSEANETQKKLISYMELAEERGRELEEVREELAQYEKQSE